jgi:FAD/FMN-containing dehydrogenase
MRASRIGRAGLAWFPAWMISTAQLQDTLKGRLITPDDPDYDDARRVFSGAIDRRPAVIARVTDADDVATVIRAARESGQELAVRSGGHSGAGHGVSEGGIVLDLRDLNALEIDAQARTAWAETGITAGAYTVAAGAHGLATGFGDTGSVGVGGLTLGGGIGFLVRKHGMTIDALLAADVVTADGELVRADAESHPDLFWAIRGGGGNFGVATRLQFRLDPVESIVGGMLILPASAEVVDGFMAEAAAAPEELSTIVVVMKAPPMPFLPAEAHGRLIVLAQMAYAGPVDQAERALAPFRSLAEPIADMLRPMPYADIYPPEEEEFRPIAALRTMFMDSFDSRDAEAIIEAIEASTAPMAAAQLRVLGGAMARVPADATAFAHRDRPIMANVTSVATSVDALDAPAAWVADLSQRLSLGDDAGYVGFLGDEGEARVRATYPGATYDRLAAVKAQYDPDNVFRRNQNIPPAA